MLGSTLTLELKSLPQESAPLLKVSSPPLAQCHIRPTAPEGSEDVFECLPTRSAPTLTLAIGLPSLILAPFPTCPPPLRHTLRRTSRRSPPRTPPHPNPYSSLPPLASIVQPNPPNLPIPPLLPQIFKAPSYQECTDTSVPWEFDGAKPLLGAALADGVAHPSTDALDHLAF